MLGLEGKTALVTGAGAGIGRSIADAFAKNGVRVVAIEVDAGRVDELKQSMRDAHVEAEIFHGDVCRQEDVDAVVAAAGQRFGRIDILVNNVGNHLMLKPFVEQTDEDWESVYDINLCQVFRVTRAAIPLLMRADYAGGESSSIINISSIEAFRGIPMTSIYSSCKHAITGFTRCLALELGRDGVRVNAIAMETTETATIEPSRYVALADRDHVPTWVPLGRFGRPSDIAGCALFLASDMSTWMTGATLNVDGGVLAAAGWFRDRQGNWTNVPKIEGPGFTGYYPAAS